MSTSILLAPFQITFSFFIMGFFLSIFLISCLLWLQTSPPLLNTVLLQITLANAHFKMHSQLWLKGTHKTAYAVWYISQMKCMSYQCNCCNLFFLSSSCCDGYKLCKFTALINEFSHYSCNSLSSCVYNYLLHSLSHTRFTLFQYSSAVHSQCRAH